MTKEDIIVTLNFQNRENWFTYLGKKILMLYQDSLSIQYQLQIHDIFRRHLLPQGQIITILCIKITRHGRIFRAYKIRVF